ncbi:MAG TPA: radical SAM protein, partial [Phycisphaerales bacterium]|nr:radical SAM protein [Phycisphaerales bacterium]
KPLPSVRAEALELIRDGAFELSLIGQDTTSYRDDIGIGLGSAPPGRAHLAGLPGLLRTVSGAFDEAGVRDGWVRLMYAYPSNFSDLMIETLAELSALGGGGRVVPYIDIPLQHASDRMLTAMRRNVSAGHQRALIHRLRERVPGMAVRTTFISGFPGETEADHAELLRFVEEMRFDALGVFTYSPEDQTVAGRMEGDPALAVPAEVKERRREELMLLQQKLAFARAASHAAAFDEHKPGRGGVRFDVLIDAATGTAGRATAGVSKGGGLYQGRTYFQAPQVDAVTFVQSARRLSPGELVRCVVVGSDGYDLVARPVDDLENRTPLRVLRRS